MTIEELKKEFWRKWYTLDADKYKELFMADLDKIIEEAKGKWIKVEDKLPNDLDLTLCVNESGGIWVSQFYGKEWEDEQPTHWMPLPGQPQKKEPTDEG